MNGFTKAILECGMGCKSRLSVDREISREEKELNGLIRLSSWLGLFDVLFVLHLSHVRNYPIRGSVELAKYVLYLTGTRVL